jgi:Insertion element 4 transposase N-terminal/Transposase DDE domain
MPRGWLSPKGRVLSRVGIGVLTHVVPPGLVDEAAGTAREARFRSLPARLTMYFVLGTCLFGGTPYAQALRALASGLEGPLAAAGWAFPAVTALARARRRLGEAPLERLFRALCSALSPGREPWMLVSGLLAVAWDGTVLAAEATAANVAAFGRAGGRKGGHYPMLRVVSLVACGTRGLLGAEAGPVRGKGSGERDLAARLTGALAPGMLLLADRGFYSWSLWHAAAATGADLLWRVQSSLLLPVVRPLPDGSWLTRIEDPKEKGNRYRKNGKRRRAGKPEDRSPLPGVTVRVIEFTLAVAGDDGKARTQRYRMITTLLDHRAHPARRLAAGYARRWGIELAYRELKAVLRGPRGLLAGATPDLARQHMWAYLTVYQAIRTLIARAAAGAGLDPARLSFTAALAAARDSVTAARDSMPAALAGHEAAVLAAPVPERKGRVYPRTVKAHAAVYGTGKTGKAGISQHAQCTITLTTPDPSTTQRHSQDKHHQKQTANAP